MTLKREDWPDAFHPDGRQKDGYEVYAENMGVSDFETPPPDPLLRASSQCPVCGVGVPHSHSIEELNSLRRKVAYLESKLGAAAAPTQEPAGEPVAPDFMAEFISLCELCDINEQMDDDGYGWKALYLRAKSLTRST